jgi:uncharacterized SAM-binding protein YcdF (DUF218 family)
MPGVKLFRFISHKPRRFLLAVLALLFGAALVALLFPEQMLLMDSGEVQADVIVVLGGGLGERPIRAAELFKSGAAPEIIVSGGGDAEDNCRLLERNGVPAASIEVELKSKSTKQNANFCIPMLRRLGARRVIIVTTWYHSRRALQCFRHYAPDIRFFSRPSYFGYPGTAESWQRKALKNYIRAEYLKLPGYWVCYGVCPF